MNAIHPKKQRGIYAIEFVMVSALFLFVLFALIEFGRLMYLYNAAGDATRMGARMAVVCNKDAAAIKTRMIAQVPGLTAGNIDITYLPAGCVAAKSLSTEVACESVTVKLKDFTTTLSLPVQFSLGSIFIPAFSTTLVRESMSSTSNSLCT